MRVLLTQENVKLYNISVAINTKWLEEIVTKIDRVIDIEPILKRYGELVYDDDLGFLYEIDDGRFISLIVSLYGELRKQEVLSGISFFDSSEDMDSRVLVLVEEFERNLAHS